MNKKTLSSFVRRCSIRTIVLLAGTFLLASCGEDMVDGDRLPDGKYPVTFTATGLEAMATTRVATDGTWTEGDEVAVMIGNNVKKYVSIGSGTTTTLKAAPGVSPYFWQSSSEKMTVRACYPYEAHPSAGFTVQTDQSGRDFDGYRQSDFLFAAKDMSFKIKEGLTFKHMPAKVVINLKAGDSVLESDVADATVTLVNQAATSGAILYDPATGDTDAGVLPPSTTTTVITPKTIQTVTSGYQKTVQALLVPKQMTNTPFVKVKTGGNTYYYTPANDTDGILHSSKEYTYNITVRKDGLEVLLAENGEWTSAGETSIGSKELAPGYSASDLKPGDYYYSDGTWSDGGYRKYPDGSTTVLDIKPVLTNPNTGAARTVIGLVFYAGDVAKDDEKLKNGNISDGGSFSGLGDTSTGSHGLVVALKDASPGVVWGTWGTVTNIGTGNNGDTGGDAKLCGYSNSLAIQVWNTQYSDNQITAYPPITDYASSHTAPANSSGWYLPSIRELSTLCSGWKKDSWAVGNTYGGIDDNSLVKTINDKLTALNSSSNGSADAIVGYWYWSSSESSEIGGVFFVTMDTGRIGVGAKTYAGSRVRAILAF